VVGVDEGSETSLFTVEISVDIVAIDGGLEPTWNLSCHELLLLFSVAAHVVVVESDEGCEMSVLRLEVSVDIVAIHGVLVMFSDEELGLSLSYVIFVCCLAWFHALPPLARGWVNEAVHVPRRRAQAVKQVVTTRTTYILLRSDYIIETMQLARHRLGSSSQTLSLRSALAQSLRYG
jgi:hypothetical protein